ncbi:MAG: hypothetical protein J0L92_22605 [Deltaproteobacteria bacterium]|nr:hypothetical protein [Deltaproteobacteria bacterium]
MQIETEARGTVVVAEERAPVREYVRALLERALPGVAQVSATSSVDALEVLEALSAHACGPVVLVSGVHLCQVDELAEHVWGSSMPVSVVLLGGSDTPSDRARARQLEATLIEGPDGFRRLAEVVAELLTPTLH